MNKKIAITLIELLVSMSILSFVVLAAISLEIAARRFSATSTKDAEVLNDISSLMEHITKYVTVASNISSSLSDTLEIRIDNNNTPWNVSDDTPYTYSFDIPNYKVWFLSGAGSEEIAKRITNLAFTPYSDRLNVNITARFNPTQGQSLENPEMSLSTDISLRRLIPSN